MRRSTLAITSLLLCLCGVLGTARAQSGPPAQHRADELVGKTVADRPSALYRFERHTLGSVDGKRHYRIDLSVPRAPAPRAGYPVLYMLDGNAAMATLTEHDLALISGANPPVLVAIGYDVPTRNDVVSRAYDYTPPVYEHGRLLADPTVRGRVGGGADHFLAFIETRIKPLLRSRAGTDPQKEYLWGHSYGGLFALHALFTQPDAFSGYIVGDPSAWWHNGVLLKEWQAFDKARAADNRIALLIGTKPRDPDRPPPPEQQPGSPIDTRAAVKEMAEGLRQAGARASYDTFPQHGHGDMIRVSLERALLIAAEP
jgi:predicted alpha/beta superfamily hydrolase